MSEILQSLLQLKADICASTESLQGLAATASLILQPSRYSVIERAQKENGQLACTQVAPAQEVSSSNIRESIERLELFVDRVDSAIDCIKQCLLQYPPDSSGENLQRVQIGLSFNGGKDCTVVLHLLRVAVVLLNTDSSDEGLSGRKNYSDETKQQHHHQQQQQHKRSLSDTSDVIAYSSDRNENLGKISDALSSSPRSNVSEGSQCCDELIQAGKSSRINIGRYVLPFTFSGSKDGFEEEAQFIDDTMNTYSKVEMQKFEDVPFKEGVAHLVDNCGMKAILMGTRSTDPDGKWLKGVWSSSSEGWPSFMRVNPCYAWDYHDIWAFLRVFKLPYLNLYDSGYTSIGQRSNTRPNPYLLIRPESKLQPTQEMYLPAYLLQDPLHERAGRS